MSYCSENWIANPTLYYTYLLEILIPSTICQKERITLSSVRMDPEVLRRGHADTGQCFHCEIYTQQIYSLGDSATSLCHLKCCLWQPKAFSPRKNIIEAASWSHKNMPTRILSHKWYQHSPNWYLDASMWSHVTRGINGILFLIAVKARRLVSI